MDTATYGVGVPFEDLVELGHVCNSTAIKVTTYLFARLTRKVPILKFIRLRRWSPQQATGPGARPGTFWFKLTADLVTRS